MSDLVPVERIENRILVIRGQKVILDRDLAELYGVETRALKQAVRRNIERFPLDFMFELNNEEFTKWRSQIVISNSDKMGLRYAPMAFTEHGVAMLSAVLKSSKAIEVSILIVRAFVRMRELISTHKEMANKINELESKVGGHDKAINGIIQTLRQLMTPEVKNKPKIGFKNKR